MPLDAIPEAPRDPPPPFVKVTLFTDTDGMARFREEPVDLDGGSPEARLSALLPASAVQFRQSPVGFAHGFHCTTEPQWLFVLAGKIEVSLQDGSSRIFKAGQCFYSIDTLPQGARFDPAVHGHRSRQVGDEPLVAAFVKG